MLSPLSLPGAPDFAFLTHLQVCGEMGWIFWLEVGGSLRKACFPGRLTPQLSSGLPI